MQNEKEQIINVNQEVNASTAGTATIQESYPSCRLAGCTVWGSKNMKRVLLFMCLFVGVLCACSQSITTEGQTWQEQYDLGIRYLSEGSYEEAIIAFTAAIEIDPKQALAYVGRGDAYIGLGETEENLAAAQADYEKALSIDATFVEVYQKLAQTYLALGQSDKMIEILEQGYELIGDKTLRKSLDDILSKMSEEGSNGNNNGIVDFIGETMGNVIERYGDDYFAGNYEGSTYIAYWDIATFYFGTSVDYPDNNAVINTISLYSNASLVGNLTGSMTYPELVDAVGREVKLEQPDYYFSEIDNNYSYSTEFTYRGYNVFYVWLEDPETNASTSATVTKITDTYEQPYYEPDMEMITERFKRVGLNYLVEVLSIPADAGFVFTNIKYRSDVWWNMDCYAPTDNGLRIYAIFELDPWNDIATITPGWGGDFDAEFKISEYDY